MNREELQQKQMDLWKLSSNSGQIRKNSKVQKNVSISRLGCDADYELVQYNDDYQDIIPDLRCKSTDSEGYMKYTNRSIIVKTISGLESSVRLRIGINRITSYIANYANTVFDIIKNKTKEQDVVITFPRAFMIMAHRKGIINKDIYQVDYYNQDIIDKIESTSASVWNNIPVKDVLDTYYENLLSSWMSGILADYHKLFTTIKSRTHNDSNKKVKFIPTTIFVKELSEDPDLFVKFYKI